MISPYLKPLIMHYLGWVGSVLLVLGMFFVGEKAAIGFVIAGIGEFLWVVKSRYDRQWDLFSICVIFCGVYAYNFWKWL